jgi:hypothetical protein
MPETNLLRQSGHDEKARRGLVMTLGREQRP